MAPICLPMNAFVRGEGPLCFGILPLDRNKARGKEGTAVSFHCFYLSNHLRSFFFYLSSLKLNNKEALIFIIGHYYFQTKTGYQKIQKGKKSPEMLSDCMCGFSQEGRLHGKEAENISVNALLDHRDPSPLQHTH